MRAKIIIISTFVFLNGAVLLGQAISDNLGNSTRFGEAAGLNNTGDEVSIFGRSAGLNNTGDYNSFFGFNAGRNTTGSNNSFFGHLSGLSNTTGARNNFFGAHAGESNDSGSWNNFFGYNSGFNNTTGGTNSFFGYSSGLSNISGHCNSFFGGISGANNISGHSNSFFGEASGVNNKAGSYNIAIGYSAGPALLSDDIDSTLYIDVHSTNDPLIYGQFNKHLVRINGSFEAMGGMSNSSDVNRKSDIIEIDEQNILEKVAQLELSEWSYKDESDVRHLGPMAQDFYKAFGLGKNETTITTLDADGVALAAIQALYEQWQKEKERNDQLEKNVCELKKMNVDQLLAMKDLMDRITKLENR